MIVQLLPGAMSVSYTHLDVYKRQAYSLKEAVRSEINQLIEDDITEPSQSPYTSPIVAIKKKNGKVRLCLDAREINIETKLSLIHISHTYIDCK